MGPFSFPVTDVGNGYEAGVEFSLRLLSDVLYKHALSHNLKLRK